MIGRFPNNEQKEIPLKPAKGWLRLLWGLIRRYPTAVGGALVLICLGLLTLCAPYISSDPFDMNIIHRLKPPSAARWFGTDMLGRDLYSRTLYGGRISLTIGLSVAISASSIGLLIGLICGYIRAVDAVVMRVMDGLMAIPEILLAIALMAITSASMENVIIAITIPEVPRVTRLIRSMVMTIREEPYVEAAICSGTFTWKILSRHILPNTVGPLLVQGTYVFASGVILEALLGFIGAGTPPEIPSWGNIMAEGRVYYQVAPWIIIFPGIFLSLTVLAVNVLGDVLRDMLDPRLARQF